jgi:hypothetical protein
LQNNNANQHILQCVVLPYEGRHPSNVPKGGQLVTLYTADAAITALSWLNSKDLKHSNGSLAVGKAYAHDIPYDFNGATVILNRFELHPAGSALNYVEEDACPIPGEVAAIRRLISEIDNVHLRRFISTALSVPLAFSRFWTCPVSCAVYTEKGTLAVNSRQAAELAARAMADQPAWMAFAATYGLLHDYGKIWCHEEDEFCELPKHLLADEIRYEMLLPALAELKQASPEAGKVMESLISGSWRIDGLEISRCIGRTVQTIIENQTKAYMSGAPRGYSGWDPVIVK